MDRRADRSLRPSPHNNKGYMIHRPLCFISLHSTSNTDNAAADIQEEGGNKNYCL